MFYLEDVVISSKSFMSVCICMYHFHETLIASPLRPQLDILLSIDGSKSCGGNLAFSPNNLPAVASSLDCYAGNKVEEICLSEHGVKTQRFRHHDLPQQMHKLLSPDHFR